MRASGEGSGCGSRRSAAELRRREVGNRVRCSDDGGGMDEASAMRGSGQAEKKMKTETYIFCTGV